MLSVETSDGPGAGVVHELRHSPDETRELVRRVSRSLRRALDLADQAATGAEPELGAVHIDSALQLLAEDLAEVARVSAPYHQGF